MEFVGKYVQLEAVIVSELSLYLKNITYFYCFVILGFISHAKSFMYTLSESTHKIFEGNKGD